MNLLRYHLRNFRRLENAIVTLEESDTIFVGPNNSGKTSATAAFRLLVAQTHELKIHDFSAPLIAQFDKHQTPADGGTELIFPAIEIDLWFSVKPETEYGRIASLLSSVSLIHDEVGVRIVFSVEDAQKMIEAYRIAYPPVSVDGVVRSEKGLSHFLSEGGHLSRHFSFKYFSLELIRVVGKSDTVLSHPLDRDFGKSALASLLRVDFVEAQRNIDDLEASRSNRLSSVFADYYKSNLDKPTVDAAAFAVINKSNDSLSDHYRDQFQPLFDVIARLGFPSINDRDLRILSSLSPDSALRGNTTLRYEEKASGHQLPESYNGLGFKNMIFMAIQLTHFHKRWLSTEERRPLCQMIFIEEPEVHLHAQVQQAFIRQINEIIKMTAAEHREPSMKPQIVVTTHSSHILDEVDFGKVRYFRRIKTMHDTSPPTGKEIIKVASEVLSLRDFTPDGPPPNEKLTPEEVQAAQKETLKFLSKYLRLTHCDLFFSDAAILVEGTVERLLFPSFIERGFDGLKSAYLTVLEVGGAFAHLFIPLVDFIGLPTLVVTDLDSVDPTARRSACRADKSACVTSNKTLSNAFGSDLVTDLLKLKEQDRISAVGHNPRFIACQGTIAVTGYSPKDHMIPRTFEEAFIYTNLPAVRSGLLDTFTPLPPTADYETDYTSIYEAVKSKGYKKVEFALNQMASNHSWLTPSYICDGLKWLDRILTPLPSGTKGTP
jgi:predicted ATP-dependent endonuclease of OLD family